MTKLAPEWVQTSDPVIRSPARYRWTTAPALRVHRAFYRLPESTLQVAKVAKVLHCINNGTIAQYKGKNIDEIEFDLEGAYNC